MNPRSSLALALLVSTVNAGRHLSDLIETKARGKDRSKRLKVSRSTKKPDEQKQQAAQDKRLRRQERNRRLQEKQQ